MHAYIARNLNEYINILVIAVASFTNAGLQTEMLKIKKLSALAMMVLWVRIPQDAEILNE